jgi:hypothetical protein
MQPAMRECWRAYTRRRELDRVASETLLHRAVSFAGVGLLSIAYTAARRSTDLGSNLILHLQLAMNILTRPGEAAVQLLGVADGGG